jgi:hypothetical protein
MSDTDSTQSAAVWPVLYLVRPGAEPPGDYLGWVVKIPAEPTAQALAGAGCPVRPDRLPAGQAPLDAALEALGLPGKLAGLGRPARMVAWGFVVPSAWEQAVVGWVARQVELEPMWQDGQAARGPDALADPAMEQVAAVFVDPFHTLEVRDPDRVCWIEGADPELEALGVARRLRQELAQYDPAQ